MVTKYQIKLSYSTGDSDGSYDKETYLEPVWHDLDLARKNLNYIAEHYRMYRSRHDYGTQLSYVEIIKNESDKPWFVNEPKLYCTSLNRSIREQDKETVGDGNWEYRPDEHMASSCIKLQMDNGNMLQLSAFWCGHFASLSEAEIIIDNDLKITF